MRMRDLVKRMERLAVEGRGDPEIAHTKADELLVAAVNCLAPYATDTPDEGEADFLLDAYMSVPKWYA